MAYPRECSMYTWKECIFCCCYVEYPKIGFHCSVFYIFTYLPTHSSSEKLNSPTLIITELSVSPLDSTSIYFMYFRAWWCMCVIIMVCWWSDTLSLWKDHYFCIKVVDESELRLWLCWHSSSSRIRCSSWLQKRRLLLKCFLINL